MKLNLSREFNDESNIKYHKERIEVILASIESIINDYGSYINNMEEVRNKRDYVQRMSYEYKSESGKKPLNKNKLSEIVTKVFEIEESLINLSAKIWNGEIKKGKIILFHRPANKENLLEKSFRSTTVVFVNPNIDDCITNNTFGSASFGEGYELDEGENIIVGNNIDISSGLFVSDWVDHIEYFEIKCGGQTKKLWTRQACSRICTPLQAAKNFNFSHHPTPNEIVIATSLSEDSMNDEKLKCMLFDGTLKGYVMLRVHMFREGIHLPIKPVYLNPFKEKDTVDDLYYICRAYNPDVTKKQIDVLCEEYYIFMQKYEKENGKFVQKDISAIYEERGKDFECEFDEIENIYRCRKHYDEQATYIFEPAYSKEGNQAYLKRAAYYVQSIVDYKNSSNIYFSPVCYELCTVNIGGRKVFGTIQKEIPTKYDSAQLKQGKLIELVKNDWKIADQLMREFIVDYLLCNLNSGADSFIIDENGVLRGVDKGNSFRNLNKVSDKIDITYNPNSSYGEQEPIYNTIFRMYQNGEIDLDLDFEDYINKVESINNYEYMELFRPYVESLYGSGSQESEDFLKRIVERKKNLREACSKLVFALQSTRKKFDRENQTSDDNAIPSNHRRTLL